MKMPGEITTIDIESVYVGARLRDVHAERVASLAASIKDIGLQTPITIRILPFVEIDGEEVFDVPALIAGRHRMEACKQLGMTDIPCIEVNCDDIEAQMWEIAENLHRSELTVLERDQHVAKWVELAAGRFAQVAHNPKGGRPVKTGALAAEKELGIKRDDASRALKVASLTPEAKEAAKEVGLDDNRTALLQAAKAEPAQQAAVIRTFAENKAVSRNKLDGDLKVRAAKEVASMIAEHVPGEWWDALKSNLYAAGASNIANELTNITGQSIMDKRYGA